MCRRYTAARFAERIAAVRRAMPDAFIGIDVIVGFPGETEADFRATNELLEGLEPAYLHIFPFSERPGTPAVGLPGKVQASVATRRVGELEALSPGCTAPSAHGPKARRTRCCSKARCAAA